jgi:hypothetical protein
MRLQVSTRVDGFHRWPGAPDTRSYLRERHHHEFRVRVVIGVDDPDREFEFHDVRDRLDGVLAEAFPLGEFGDKSCEQIGLEVLTRMPEASMVRVDEDDRHGAVVDRDPDVALMAGRPRPEVITVCGSTRFKGETQAAILELEREGKAVFSVGGFTHADRIPTPDAEKAGFDALHKAKIEMSDAIYVVNVDGYTGASTADEIMLAWRLGIPVRWRYPEYALDHEPIERFFSEMEKVLLANAEKGGWRDEGLGVLLDGVQKEFLELREAVHRYVNGPAREEMMRDVVHEAADVANRAMMVADVARMMWGKGYR